MIKAIFFDWMKTLANIGNLAPISHLLNKEEHEEVSTKPLNKCNISDKKKKEIERILKENFDVVLYPDSDKIIDSLRKRYKLVIISNMYSTTIELVKENFKNFLKKFDLLSFSAEAGFHKPDKKFFIRTLEELNNKIKKDIKPYEVLVIGDNKEKDLLPALEVGMQARLINRNKEKLKDVLIGI